MTITTTTTESTGTGDNVEDTFSYNFKIQDDADLEVYLDDVLQGSGYAVTGAGADSGGTVVFDVAPGAGVAVKLKRNVRPLVQNTDLVSFGRNRIQGIEDAIDRIVMAFQEIDT